jgi:hypothetical protein
VRPVRLIGADALRRHILGTGALLVERLQSRPRGDAK